MHPSSTPRMTCYINITTQLGSQETHMYEDVIDNNDLTRLFATESPVYSLKSYEISPDLWINL